MRSNRSQGFLLTWTEELPRPLAVFIRVAGWCLLTALVTEGFCFYLLHAGWPYRSPLLYEYFPDVYNLAARFQHFHTLEFFTETVDLPFMYPAPMAACYRLLFYTAPYEVPVLLSFVALCFVIAGVFLGRALIQRGLPTRATVGLLVFSLLTSFPIWVEMKQANQEIVSWLFIMLGLWCFTTGRSYPAAIFLGIAGSLKITPFFYLGLFVARRQYRQVWVALLAAVTVTIPSLWWEYPHVLTSWQLTRAALAKFPALETLRVLPETGFDHSLFGLIKRVSFIHVSAKAHVSMLAAYSAVSLVAFVALYFGWIRRLPMINQVLCLCLATLLLPPTSYDYTLMSLYAPWTLLVLLAVRRRGIETPALVPAMICFAILFTPQTEFIRNQISVGGQIKAVTMIVLFTVALRYPFEGPSATEHATADLLRSPHPPFATA